MRFPALLAFAVPLSIPALAMARPFEIGVGGGLVRTSAEADQSEDAPAFEELYGRAMLSDHVAFQAEVDKIERGPGHIRGATGLVSTDLAKGPWVPSLELGLGLDRISYDDGSSTQSYTHVEAGVALHYYAASGLVIGIDARLGMRYGGHEVDTPVFDDNGPPLGAKFTPRFFGSGALQDGDYASVRATIGVRF